jgi:Spy/CpxP family protein refolding chaperone
MNTHKKTINTAVTVAVSAAIGMAQAALAEPQGGCNEEGGRHCCVDWNRLNLTGQQSEQIEALKQDWTLKYNHLQPQIVEQQQKLVKLLADPKADPLDIMATQQSIARMKEQLRNEATTNYLRKRAVLSEIQRRQLEANMQQLVAERQRGQQLVQPQPGQGGFMDNLIRSVKWTIDQH